MEAHAFTVDDAASIARVQVLAELAHELLKRSHDSALAARTIVDVGFGTLAFYDDLRPIDISGPIEVGGDDVVGALKDRIKELRVRADSIDETGSLREAVDVAQSALDGATHAFWMVRDRLKNDG